MKESSASSSSLTVVVAGGGISGLSAALAAAENGAHVRVIEKSPKLGGSFALSGGLVWTYPTMTTVDELAPFGDPLLQSMIVDEIGPGKLWLANHGVVIGAPVDMPHGGRGHEVSPRQVIEALGQALDGLGAELLLGRSLTSLRVEGGRVTGGELRGPDGADSFTCDSLVLATGGFQGNPEMVARYLQVPPENLQLRANRWSTGDGAYAAMGAGAGLTSGVTHFYGHAVAAPPATFAPSQFREASQYYGTASVALNLAGERFADEAGGSGEEHINHALAHQPGGLGFYVIDAEIAAMSTILDLNTQVMIDNAARFGAPYATAPTLEELCTQLSSFGVPSARALSTLLEYNESMIGSSSGGLWPPRTGHRRPLATPPFQAVGVQSAITFTMGGIAVDNEMRVLSRSGGSSIMNGPVDPTSSQGETPIPGLWAAGCDVGGVSYGGYLGGIASAIVTGRTAGTNASRV